MVCELLFAGAELTCIKLLYTGKNQIVIINIIIIIIIIVCIVHGPLRQRAEKDELAPAENRTESDIIKKTSASNDR